MGEAYYVTSRLEGGEEIEVQTPEDEYEGVVSDVFEVENHDTFDRVVMLAFGEKGKKYTLATDRKEKATYLTLANRDESGSMYDWEPIGVVKSIEQKVSA